IEGEALPDKLCKAFKPIFQGMPGLKSYKDFTIRLENGVNLVWPFILRDFPPVKKAIDIIGGFPNKLVVQGVAEEPTTLLLRCTLGELPFPKVFPKCFRATEPFFELYTQPIGCSLGMIVKVALPPHKEEVDFFTRINLPLFLIKSEASITGGMERDWRDAMGIKGLTIADVKLKGGIDIEKKAPNLGLTGTVGIGPKRVTVAAIIPLSKNITAVGLKGKVNELNLRDVFMMAMMMGGGLNNPECQVPYDKLPVDKFGLKNVEVMVSTKEDRDLKMGQGVTIRGDLNFIKKEFGKIFINVRSTGIIAKGRLGKIKLGPVLELSGDGPDGKPGTADDGAAMDIASSLTAQQCMITGYSNLFGIKQTLKIAMTLDKAYFKYREKVWKLYMAQVEGMQSLNPKKPEWGIKVEFEADFFKDIEDGVNAVVGAKTPAWLKTAFSKVIRVNSAGFSILLSQLLNNKTPELHVDVGYLGKREVVRLQYDFTKNKQALDKLVAKLAAKVLKEMEKFGANVGKMAAKAAKAVADTAAKGAVVAFGAATKGAVAAARGAEIGAKKTIEYTNKAYNSSTKAAAKAVNWTRSSVTSVAKKSAAIAAAAQRAAAERARQAAAAAKRAADAAKNAAKKGANKVGGAAKKAGKKIKSWFSDERLKTNLVPLN
ncbi:hypothetical protein ACFL35_03645, partial [Candidatus Riflebacteria bacterium]